MYSTAATRRVDLLSQPRLSPASDARVSLPSPTEHQRGEAQRRKTRYPPDMIGVYLSQVERIVGKGDGEGRIWCDENTAWPFT